MVFGLSGLQSQAIAYPDDRLGVGGYRQKPLKNINGHAHPRFSWLPIPILRAEEIISPTTC